MKSFTAYTIAAVMLVAVSTAEVCAGDICDQIREAAERTATNSAERLRAFREYNECKRNMEAAKQESR